MKNDINCIILCAGTGSRMNCDEKNKVCFEVLGKPAVVRVIEALKECGVGKFVVVVGSKAESVMNVTADIPGVTFAFQKEQKGTGNAAMCGLKVLNDFEADGPVLVVMGDKLIDKSVFEKLIEDFYAKNSDVSLITQPTPFNKSGGKIVMERDNVLGIIENMDYFLLKVREELTSGKDINDIYADLQLTEKQKSKIEAKLSEIKNPAEKCYIEINGRKLSSDEIAESGIVNCATYLYKREAINSAVYGLDSDNAQNEIYFTDTVKNIAKNGLVSSVNVSERSLIHTFNTPEELEAINQYFNGEKNNE